MSIALQHVTKAFDAAPVVNDVTLQVAAGSFFAVLGPSGCGKSTLLRLIAGLEHIDAGEIVLAGQRVAAESKLHVPSERRNVGVVFQSYALWPHMTVLENVAFPIQTAGVRPAQAATTATQHLRTVELEAFAARKPAELSGGQRQRVALARCLAQQARTILMDEPLANLDPHLRAAMEEELAAFHQRTHATVLYITHDQREAMALADTLAVMWHGRILQVGAPDVVYRRPQNEEVARFIGRSAIIPADITEVARGRARISLAGSELTAICDDPTRVGQGQVVIRPDDLTIDEGNLPGTLQATVTRVAYRGGVWDVAAIHAGLREPFQLTTTNRVQNGDVVHVRVQRAWVLPGNHRSVPPWDHT